MEKQKIIVNELCTACASCAQRCPQQCIEMKSNEEGFEYPVIDEKKCINCGICAKVCPLNKSEDNTDKHNIPKSYAVINKNSEVRYESSSGGAFSVFAENIIDKGGIVYGCVLNKKLEAVHIGVENKQDLIRLRGSKYVQSKIGNVYKEIEEHLKNDRYVMFVGTPCQVSGLDCYLGRKYDKLLLVDFICHGVPSPLIFKEYISYIQGKYKEKVCDFKFRNKDYGWNQTGLQLGTKYVLGSGKTVRKYPAVKDVYMNGFLSDIYLRESCYKCKFKSIPKDYADITIADFWGINKIDKQLNDKKGTSLVLIHSEKGQKKWDEINDLVVYKEVKYEDAIRKNKSLIKSAKENRERISFFGDYKNKGFEYVMRRYLNPLKWIFDKAKKMMLK